MTRGAPTAHRADTRDRWRMPWGALLVVALAWAGMLVLLYPTVASWASQYNQSKVIASAAVTANSRTKADQEAALARARAYNDALAGGAQYSANANAPTSTAGTDADREYRTLLSEDSTGLMGRLQIPSINVDLPIYHGTSDATLLRGIGHLEGTSLPVGGVDTHAVLTGHRGLADAVMFTYLDRVRTGDTFTVSTMGQALTYRVVETKVVDPDQTESLNVRAGQDLVTLVTCTPLGINSQRIFVTGQRVIPTPVSAVQKAAAPPAVPTFPWWALALGAGTLLAALGVWNAGRPRRPRRSAPGPDPAGAPPRAQGPAPAITGDPPAAPVPVGAPAPDRASGRPPTPRPSPR